MKRYNLFIVSIFLLALVIQGCETVPSQKNRNSLRYGMTSSQTDSLLGNRMNAGNKFGYDIISYGYYDTFGSLTDVMYAVFKDNSLVGFYNRPDYLAWKENEFMRVYSDPNTPETVRQAMKMQYEQDKADNRALLQATTGLIMAQQLSQPTYQAPKLPKTTRCVKTGYSTSCTTS